MQRRPPASKLACRSRVLALGGLVGCADVALDERAAFVQEVLVNDNRIWLYRDAPKVADKFEKMADDP